MLNTLNINLKTDIKNDRATALGIKLMSQDKNNNQFILRFTNGGEPVTLDDTYTVEILTKFTNSGASRLTSATVRQDYATWQFDTEYITQDEMVYNYVYVRKAGSLVVSADANAFYFDVGLSEIDKNAGRVAEIYDENYQKYLDEFKDNVDFEEIAQAEQARKEAELLREENYNQKVDTAIVEADVVAKVDNKVTELAPQINDLTAQLAQTAKKTVNVMKHEVNKNLTDSSTLTITQRSAVRPLVTFVDDDGRSEIMTRLKPILESKGVPCTVGIISDFVGTPGYCDANELMALADIGWEIASHEKTHIHMAGITDDQTIYEEIVQSKEDLLKMGFDVKNIVYPYGETNTKLLELARKYYKSGVAVLESPLNDSTNPLPLNDTFKLKRVAFGVFGDNLNMTTYKAAVDKAISENSWLIFMTHIGNQPLEADQDLIDLIDYIQSNNIDIMTLDDGLRVFGDKVNIESVLKVTADNRVSSDVISFTRSDNSFVVLPNDPITIFPAKQKTYTQIYQTISTGFPENKAGLLITDRIETSHGFSSQEYTIYQENRVYKRIWLSGNVWSEWTQVGQTTIKVSAESATILANPITDYPKLKETIIPIMNGAGSPDGRGGVYRVYRFAEDSAYGYSEYKNYDSDNKYIRNWASGAWTPWIKIGTGRGITSSRPTNVKIGYCYFDTTLGKPIWLKTEPNTWVDATGTVV